MSRSRFLVLLAVVLGLLTLGFPRAALAGDWIHAGSSLRYKTLGPFTVKVYTIHSFVKEKPKERSKNGVIAHEGDKQLLLYMHRDVGTDKMKNAFREAFKLNGYGDTAKIEQFVAALGSGDVVEWEKDKKMPPSVSINYNAGSQTTSISVPGHGNASVGGVDFMKAVWSIWYGKIDQPNMGDELIATLPKD